jgi:hypothetical protein
MNKLRHSINIGFWGVFFTIPLLIGLLRGAEGDYTDVGIMFLIGIVLTGVSFALRNKPVYQFRWNATCAAIFLIMYALIGFPSLRRPGGEIPTGSAILLVVIGLLPLLIFIAARVPKKEFTP